MGWYYSHRSRAELVKNLTQHGEGGRTLAHKVVAENGDIVLWAVHECSPDHPEYPGEVFIACYLLGTSGRLHGYKPMDEAMHPYYYSCPLHYLPMAPVTSQPWRDGVAAYHQNATQRAVKVASIRPGDTVKLREGCTPPEVTVIDVNQRHRSYQLRGSYNGNIYVVAEKYLA